MTKSKTTIRRKKFRRELDLVQVVKTHGHRFLFPKHSKNLAVFSEFESNHGIADLVFLKLPNRWGDCLHIAKIHPNWAYIFVLLSKKSFDIANVKTLSGCSEQYAKKVIRDLEAIGVLKQLKSYRWKVNSAFSPIAKEIVSIECKLTNWKKALSQAIRYQDFSHSSWVILDANTSIGVRRNISMFEKHNIGLALVSLNGEFELLNLPDYKDPKHMSAYWFANSVAAKKISESYLINSL